jgi:hypothetical protein
MAPVFVNYRLLPVKSGEFPFVTEFFDDYGSVIYRAEAKHSHHDAIQYGKMQIRNMYRNCSMIASVITGVHDQQEVVFTMASEEPVPA